MPTKKKSNKNITRRLHASGLLMMIASVFMVTLPFLYAGVYRYVVQNTGLPRVDELIHFSIAAGCIISLVYCLLGICVFRAGEQGTLLAKGVGAFNTVMAVLAIISAILVFLPIPDATFAYAMDLFTRTNNPQMGMLPMAIMVLIDMAFIIGLLGAVALIDDTCILDEKDK